MKKKTQRSAADKARVNLVFKGRVQGVGFRYTTERIALEMGVTGWVRNLPSGDVEVLAEGDRALLESFIDRIRQSEMGRHIRGVTADWLVFKGEFDDFRIEFVY